MDEILTTKQIAEMLQVKEETIRVYLRKGNLKGFKVKGSRFWRIKREEIDQLFKGVS